MEELQQEKFTEKRTKLQSNFKPVHQQVSVKRLRLTTGPEVLLVLIKGTRPSFHPIPLLYVLLLIGLT